MTTRSATHHDASRRRTHAMFIEQRSARLRPRARAKRSARARATGAASAHEQRALELASSDVEPPEIARARRREQLRRKALALVREPHERARLGCATDGQEQARDLAWRGAVVLGDPAGEPATPLGDRAAARRRAATSDFSARVARGPASAYAPRRRPRARQRTPRHPRACAGLHCEVASDAAARDNRRAAIERGEARATARDHERTLAARPRSLQRRAERASGERRAECASERAPSSAAARIPTGAASTQRVCGQPGHAHARRITGVRRVAARRSRARGSRCRTRRSDRAGERAPRSLLDRPRASAVARRSGACGAAAGARRARRRLRCAAR